MLIKTYDIWLKFFLILRLRLRPTAKGRSLSGPNIRLWPKAKIAHPVQHWKLDIPILVTSQPNWHTKTYHMIWVTTSLGTCLLHPVLPLLSVLTYLQVKTQFPFLYNRSLTIFLISCRLHRWLKTLVFIPLFKKEWY